MVAQRMPAACGKGTPCGAGSDILLEFHLAGEIGLRE